MPAAEYAGPRERRQAIAELKTATGASTSAPFVTFFFENYETMWLQVHEMTASRRAAKRRSPDELQAYNPLVPQGSELVATFMIEIDDPTAATVLARLGGIENRVFLEIGGERIPAFPNRHAKHHGEGKASSVQFVWFRFIPEQVARFKATGARAIVGFDHPNYSHMAVMPEPVSSRLVARPRLARSPQGWSSRRHHHLVSR